MTLRLLPCACLALSALIAAPSDADDLPCRDISFTPHVAGVPDASLWASVCLPQSHGDGVPVQLLLHGGAYDHRYWDWPYRPERYSYVRAAIGRGYVTVNLDRLGYGASTRPDGRHLTFEQGAEAVIGVIAAIEDGALGLLPGPIILNGHSMGGIVAEHVAGRHPGIAALIVSGLANTPDDVDGDDQDGGPPPGDDPPFLPATSDPRFASAPWAEGYMTTAPGARIRLFHADGTIDPAMEELEEAHKDTLSRAELAAVMTDGSDRPPFAGPALYVLGRFDAIACQGQDCRERFAGTERHLIIDGAGHSLNLSLAAPAFFDATLDWLTDRGLAP
jgi:pimeloyl-ACP methyl ester carboxylesterase